MLPSIASIFTDLSQSLTLYLLHPLFPYARASCPNRFKLWSIYIHMYCFYALSLYQHESIHFIEQYATLTKRIRRNGQNSPLYKVNLYIITFFPMGDRLHKSLEIYSCSMLLHLETMDANRTRERVKGVEHICIHFIL